MSFAQGLAKNVSAAVAKKNQKRKDFVANEMTKFKAKCTDASHRGEKSAFYSCRLEECLNDCREQYWYKLEFEKQIQELGFSRHSVYIGVGRSHSLFRLSATWDIKVSPDAPAEPPKKRLKGHVAACAVCNEEKSMIVLAPCGHVICPDCRETQKNADQCPFCRQKVSCITEGLFFS